MKSDKNFYVKTRNVLVSHQKKVNVGGIRGKSNQYVVLVCSNMQHKMRFGQLLLLGELFSCFSWFLTNNNRFAALFGVANGYREQFNTISSSVRQGKFMFQKLRCS